MSGVASVGGGFVIEVVLLRFLIEQARDDIVNGERFRGKGVQ